MADWKDLAHELDAWRQAGRCATFWWRDDDATGVTPELERLLGISTQSRAPVSLAVIPRDANDGLRDRLALHPLATAVQHGWSHDNHAPADERQQEYGPHRPTAVMIAELSKGWRRMRSFERALPVLVAPWNRMDRGLLPALPDAGLAAVSTLGPRESAEPAPGVRQTNVHVDIVDWAGTRGFVGRHAALDQVVGHLADRREGRVDGEEPTGLMTHHLFHDEGCWWFVEEFLGRTGAHPAARWLTAREAFWP